MRRARTGEVGRQLDQGGAVGRPGFPAVTPARPPTRALLRPQSARFGFVVVGELLERAARVGTARGGQREERAHAEHIEEYNDEC